MFRTVMVTAEAKNRIAQVLAHAGGALVVALGHFVRNPQDLSLGSSHDQRLTNPDPPDRL